MVGPHAATLEAALAKLKEYAGEDIAGKWKETSSKEGKKYLPVDGTPAARCDGFVPYPRRALIDFLIKIEDKGLTDDGFAEGKQIEIFEPDASGDSQCVLPACRAARSALCGRAARDCRHCARACRALAAGALLRGGA